MTFTFLLFAPSLVIRLLNKCSATIVRQKRMKSGCCSSVIDPSNHSHLSEKIVIVFYELSVFAGFFQNLKRSFCFHFIQIWPILTFFGEIQSALQVARYSSHAFWCLWSAWHSNATYLICRASLVWVFLGVYKTAFHWLLETVEQFCLQFLLIAIIWLYHLYTVMQTFRLITKNRLIHLLFGGPASAENLLLASGDYKKIFWALYSSWTLLKVCTDIRARIWMQILADFLVFE